MKILFVHNDYAAPSGEERAVAATQELLREYGHTTHEYRRTSAELQAQGFAGKMRAVAGGFYSASSCRGVAQALRAYKPDVVQIQNVYPLISPAVLPRLKRYGAPIVMRCPNYRLWCPTGLHLRQGRVCERCVAHTELMCARFNCADSWARSVSYACRSAWARLTGAFTKHVDAFLVLSAFQKAKFIERGLPESRLRVIPNYSSGVARPQPNFDVSAGSGITFVGRAAPEKGATLFLQLARRNPDLEFHMAGDGPCLPTQPPRNLRVHGFLESSRLAQLVRASRIVCLPSMWFEGFPNAILNAMEQARPVVAFRIGAIPEIVEHDSTGLLCKLGDLDNLEHEIRSLHSDPERCISLGAQGYNKAHRNYSPRVVAESLTAVYRELLR